MTKTMTTGNSCIIEVPDFKIPDGTYKAVTGCGQLTLENGIIIYTGPLVLVPPEEQELVTWAPEHYFWESLHKTPKYNVTLEISGNLFRCINKWVIDKDWHEYKTEKQV